MSQNAISLEVTNDHAVPIEPLGGTATVLNVSGDTLYYADNPQVSSSSNQGSLTAGNAYSFTGAAWIRSAGLSTVVVTVVQDATLGLQRVLMPQQFGARGDAIWAIDAAMTSGQAALACVTSAPFSSTAVDAGKLVCVPGAGAAGATLVTTISTVTDSGHAVLAANAGTTVSGATVVFGTDDTAAVRGWLSALQVSGLQGYVTGRHMVNPGATPLAANFNACTIRGVGGLTFPNSGNPNQPGGGTGYYLDPHLLFLPRAAFINAGSASANTPFFNCRDVNAVTFEDVAIINANSAFLGTLVSHEHTIASYPGWKPTMRRCYIGGIDAGVIGTGQVGVHTELCFSGLLEDCSFAFSDRHWKIAGQGYDTQTIVGCAANNMRAVGCRFNTPGTISCTNPSEATTFDSCSFGHTWGGGVIANKHGYAINHDSGFLFGDLTVLNCHFEDNLVGEAQYDWIFAGSTSSASGGVWLQGGYWGGRTTDFMVQLDGPISSVYIFQTGSGNGTSGGGGASAFQLNGQTIRVAEVTVGG